MDDTKIQIDIIDLVKSNVLPMDFELKLFAVLFSKYDFLTIAEYAKKQGLTYNGVIYQLEKNLVQNIEVNGKIYVF